MAITDSQKVDYLWKKIGYGMAKTDTNANKKAFEETIPSPLLLRAENIWQQSGSIPSSKPSETTSIVEIYKDGSGSFSATVECTEDGTSSDNRTWLTGLTDWIGTEFGTSYLVEVYIDDTGSSTPQSTGTKIFAAGSGNDDQWFFDYQAGVLNFIGQNIPSDIAAGVTGKSIYISGARYIGPKGLVSSDSFADRGTAGANWNSLTEMGSYKVNRVDWSGTTGTPTDSTVFVGVLEVLTADDAITQVFYPGTVDSSDSDVQWNRSYWNSSWTDWIKMLNDRQTVDAGTY